MKILETERLTTRELNAATDAAFVLELLNSPKFIKYIGDRGVRSVEESREFIENRYRQSYRDHGFGLYTAELKSVESKDTYTLRAARVSASDTATQIGICGFVKRGTNENTNGLICQYFPKGPNSIMCPYRKSNESSVN